MVAGGWRAFVPVATIGRPRIAASAVPRVGLVERLTGALDARVVTVTAPAGYGKTTAVALWDEADARPFAWTRLDYLDNDPAHLLLHVATAVAAVSRLDDAVVDYLRGPGREPLAQLLPSLIAALEAAGPLVIVFDDAHHLDATEAVVVLRALIDRVPRSTVIAVVGRRPVPMDLARRRLAEDVVDVDARELRMADDEAAAAIASVGVVCDRATTTRITRLCEGWAAGIVLTSMAFRDGAPIDATAGRNGLIGQYLVEEMLDRLDGTIADFVVESSVLDRFSAAQLDEVLDRTDSELLLDDLSASANGFLVALDHHRQWYRYHRLVADVLRNRLRSHDPDRLRMLASRASALFERDGDIDGALVHAVIAEDRARSAALVGRDAVRLGFDGRAGVLARRLGMLDTATFAEYPDAALARAWLGVTTGDAEMIGRSLLDAQAADRGSPLSDGTPSVKVAVALIGSLLGVGGVRDVIRQADIVRDAGDQLVNPWWGAATVMMGAAESMLGHVARARMLLEAALPATENVPGFQAAALAHLALLHLTAGDDDTAIARSEAARLLADKYDLCDVVPMVVVYATSAVMSARVGNEAAARVSVAITERLLDRLGEMAARTALLGHGLLAWTAAVVQDSAMLTRHLSAAEHAGRREPDATALLQRIDRVRALACGGHSPLTAAELRLLPYLSTHLTLQQIADTLVIGRETAKSQATAIYRKLGVSSRAGAVAESKRLGYTTV
ncbi:AAA family ATPase [Mycobacterium sp. PSTR-4-N]|uniref:AAA family ATPase n=1 Tax=Mycobacterium sp. PSTR-4-N TaxID=2917745 RepID=UPI001F14CA97|nr:AAA family ATPase [Mycobacterium sp. PSTR-4-N]MCG7592844.1 AAA family ATPase [Mycobacterium sp. PSTR-4-N]